MGTVVAIGERTRVSGFVLAGVDVLVAEGPQAVLDAWSSLPPAAELVIVTPAAAASLDPEVLSRIPPLVVVMPA